MLFRCENYKLNIATHAASLVIDWDKNLIDALNMKSFFDDRMLPQLLVLITKRGYVQQACVNSLLVAVIERIVLLLFFYLLTIFWRIII